MNVKKFYTGRVCVCYDMRRFQLFWTPAHLQLKTIACFLLLLVYMCMYEAQGYLGMILLSYIVKVHLLWFAP